MRAVLQPSDFRAYEKFIASFMLLLFAGTQVQAQSRPGADAQAAAQTTPAAWVYVANASASGSTNEITAFTAAANGSLTPIAGSPFADDVQDMVVNGKYLMAASRTAPNINAYLIQPNGALTYSAATNYAQYNGGSGNCGAAGQLFFDHTGSTLYVQEFNGSDSCSNTVVASFSVSKPTGALNYLGDDVTGVFPGMFTAAYFIGNNVYAYTADDSACMYYAIYGFQRQANGLLTGIDTSNTPLPTPPSDFNGYILNLGAADPNNHVAFIAQPANPPGCAPGPLQLATYSVDASGKLSTTSTYANMPTTSIVNFSDMKMAPSGKLLAIAGQEGLQIFHFHAASPITPYTGLLTRAPINQMFWDNHNHLYAISQASNQMFVFTITPTRHKQAPGSPYAIDDPGFIIVQPLPRY